MAEIARWGGHVFEVSPKVIRSFIDLQIKGSCETEQNEDGDKFEKRKGSLPMEVSFTVILNALAGVDVRNEAMSLVDQAAAGKADYIYVGAYKLVPCRMMLTEATVAEVQIAPNGTWIAASVMVIMRQSVVEGGSSAVPGSVASAAANVGYPAKQSAATTSTTTTAAAQSTGGSSQTHLQEAQSSISGIINNARNASAATKG